MQHLFTSYAVEWFCPLLCRLVHEFVQHSAPISALAVHPTEFLMASASIDRTLRLWDLESFEQVCCTPPDSGQVCLAGDVYLLLPMGISVSLFR